MGVAESLLFQALANGIELNPCRPHAECTPISTLPTVVIYDQVPQIEKKKKNDSKKKVKRLVTLHLSLLIKRLMLRFTCGILPRFPLSTGSQQLSSL